MRVVDNLDIYIKCWYRILILIVTIVIKLPFPRTSSFDRLRPKDLCSQCLHTPHICLPMGICPKSLAKLVRNSLSSISNSFPASGIVFSGSSKPSLLLLNDLYLFVPLLGMCS